MLDLNYALTLVVLVIIFLAFVITNKDRLTEKLISVIQSIANRLKW